MMPYHGSKNIITPPEVYRELDEEFCFDFDPCPYPRPLFFDGLTCDWGKSNYCNPPFNKPTRWVRKALAEREKGNLTVFMYPVNRWMWLLLDAKVEIRNMGDIKWVSCDGSQPSNGTGRDIGAFIIRPGL